VLLSLARQETSLKNQKRCPGNGIKRVSGLFILFSVIRQPAAAIDKWCARFVFVHTVESGFPFSQFTQVGAQREISSVYNFSD